MTVIMESEPTLVRSPRDRLPPLAILRREGRTNHRPQTRYRLALRDAHDAREARALGIPVFAIPDSAITMMGYPMRSPTLLILPRRLRRVVDTSLPVVEFVSEDAVMRPRLEDIPVALLRFDVLAARALIERNVDLLDREYLLKRIYQEDLEEEATRVRLQDFVPLPPKGEPLSERALRRVTAQNRPRGRIP
jgi:hypothetical protein